jgi:type I restriction enzyme S subunit
VNPGWQTVPFPDAVADESGGNEKTPQSEFLPEGRFAVVDQGKELVAGYVDDESRVCHAELPVVVFGDHTRCFKFVDFPFCMGADGVKVLRPKVDAHVKYLYYYFRQLRLEEHGYDRHFKYLKRTEVVLPPLPEQRRIAEVLDRAEALRAKRRAALAQLDTLTQSIFLDLHREAVSTSRIVPLANVAETSRGSFVNGPFGSDLLTSEFQDDGVPVVYIRDIREGEYRRVSQSCVSERKARDLEVCSVHPGDVLIAKVGDPPGTAAIYPKGQPTAVVTQDVIRIRVSPQEAIGEFIVGYLNSPIGMSRLAAITFEATRARFSLRDLKAMNIELPPVDVQREFADRVRVVDKLKSAHRASLAKLDALFASLQHRAFRGEL